MVDLPVRLLGAAHSLQGKTHTYSAGSSHPGPASGSFSLSNPTHYSHELPW